MTTEEDQLRALMKESVAEGIKEALKDEEAVNAFWSSAFKALSQRAQTQTGRVVLGGAMGAVRRVGIFAVLGLIVYSVGGWTALSKLVSIFWSNGS